MLILRVLLITSIFFCFPHPVVAAGDLPTPNTTQKQSLNKIVAVVNDDIITETEFNHALIAAKQQFQQNNIPIPGDQSFRQQVLDQLIYQKLQLQLAKRNNITASDAEVDSAIKEIAVHNRISLSQLKQNLDQEGIAYDTFKSQIQKQLIVSKLQRQAISGITVSKAEIASFRAKQQAKPDSKEYHVQTILIPLSETSSPEETDATKQQAETLFHQLQNGVNFSAAMNSYSGSVDLGWRPLSDLPMIFADSVSTLKKGQIVGPIKAQNGFHIIKLVATRQKNNGYTDDQIQGILYQQKFQQALETWLKELKKSAYIQTNLNQ